MNYVYYVSDDMDIMPKAGHFRKMDAEREIANLIGKEMDKCKIMKYTEYQGDIHGECSVGIVFPAHNWGISLAVYSFMQSLRLEKSTYLYAIAVGESLEYDSNNQIKVLEQFRRVVDKKNLDKKPDIFVRCAEIKRNVRNEIMTSRAAKDAPVGKVVISSILENLLFHNFDEIRNKPRIQKQFNEYGLNYSYSVQKPGQRRLGNIYLDDSMFAGVRFCRVM